MTNGNSEWSERMDRVERVVEKLADSQRNLLTAQVLFVDETRTRISELAVAQKHTEESIVKLAVAQQITELKLGEATDKLNTLIAFVDGMERRPPASS